MLALVVEYHQNGFKEGTDAAGESLQYADVYESFKQSVIMVGVSIPLTSISERR